MASQFQWSYLDPKGRLHRIGIYHGPRSGHLLVYCDSRILFVDFGVFHDKVYPFFIEDQLCELHLIREGNLMRYEFKVNTEAPTPLNQARKEAARRQARGLKLKLGIAVAALLLLMALVVGHKRKEDRRRPTDVMGHAIVLRRTHTAEGGPRLSYSWTAEGAVYRAASEAPRSPSPSPSSAFYALPLEPGDELILEWASSKPEVHRLRTDTLPPSTLAQLIERMADSLKSDTAAIQPCTLRAAWEAAGVEGLASAWQHHRPTQVESDALRLAWQRLQSDPAFRTALRKHCTR